MTMKISAKGRYGLAAMTYMAQKYADGHPITVVRIAEKLGISKIYLEQVFSLLKRAELVVSLKGAQGGYQLALPPGQISAYDVLSAIEFSLIEKTEDTVRAKAPQIDEALHGAVFSAIDRALQTTLAGVSLAKIAAESEKYGPDDNFMYFI